MSQSLPEAYADFGSAAEHPKSRLGQDEVLLLLENHTGVPAAAIAEFCNGWRAEEARKLAVEADRKRNEAHIEKERIDAAPKRGLDRSKAHLLDILLDHGDLRKPVYALRATTLKHSEGETSYYRLVKPDGNDDFRDCALDLNADTAKELANQCLGVLFAYKNVNGRYQCIAQAHAEAIHEKIAETRKIRGAIREIDGDVTTVRYIAESNRVVRGRIAPAPQSPS